MGGIVPISIAATLRSTKSSEGDSLSFSTSEPKKEDGSLLDMS